MCAGRRWTAGFAAGCIAVLVAAALLSAACGGDSAANQPTVTTMSSDGLVAHLRMSPEPATAMRPLRLTVTLTDANGRPAPDRTVGFDLAMPSMAMAPNRPAVRHTSAGVYETTAMLPMTGDWQLTVEIGSREGRLAIPFRFAAD